MAVVALDANTLAFGDLKSVRAAIDASLGRERVDDPVSTTHYSNEIHVPRARPVRCYRHHRVSMASCDDCGRVRRDQLARRREAAEAADPARPPS